MSFLPNSGFTHRGPPSDDWLGKFDWPRRARALELRRRRCQGIDLLDGVRVLDAANTYASFRIEGLDVTEQEVAAALATGPDRRAFRPRQGQRIRNHVAILMAVDRLTLAGQVLRPASFMRWYTTISCGLSTTQPSEAKAARIEQEVHRINSPELRVGAALQEIARLHVQLVNDALVPSFNGILARVLMRYHLVRCGLPPVFFPADTAPLALRQERTLLPLLMELLDLRYDQLEHAQ